MTVSSFRRLFDNPHFFFSVKLVENDPNEGESGASTDCALSEAARKTDGDKNSSETSLIGQQSRDPPLVFFCGTGFKYRNIPFPLNYELKSENFQRHMLSTRRK